MTTVVVTKNRTCYDFDSKYKAGIFLKLYIFVDNLGKSTRDGISLASRVPPGNRRNGKGEESAMIV